MMTQGSVPRILFFKSLPMLMGMLGVISFNLVDTFFIGQLGTKELAAISFTFPVAMLIGGLSMGIGTGASAVISKAIGQKNYPLVKRLTTDSLALSLLVVIIFISIGFLTIDPLFITLGASQEILPLIKEYMLIWYPGMGFLVVPMVGNSAIRATGDMKTPGMLMMFATLINIVLDPLLIFGIGPFPRMELQGAALATVIARAFTFFAALWILYFREKIITFKPTPLSEVIASWKMILYVALPSGGTNVILPLGIGVITKMIALYGAPAVAAFGVASRIEMFVMLVFMALASVLGPFIGQNWGANKIDRVTLAVKQTYIFSFLWGVFMALILALFAGVIAPLFSDNPVVIELVINYLWIVPVGYAFQGIIMNSSVSLNVLHKPFFAAGLSMLYILGLYVPLAYLGSQNFGISGVFVASPIGRIITSLIAFIVLKKVLVGYKKISEPLT